MMSSSWVKKFLFLAGLLLVILGILGYIGVLGPTPEKSIFTSNFYFVATESLVHVLAGIICFGSAVVFPLSWQKFILKIVSFLAILIGLYSWMVSHFFLGMYIFSIADIIFYLVFGGLGILLAYNAK